MTDSTDRNSSRFERWLKNKPSRPDQSIPDPFFDKDTPHGYLPKALVVVQWSDHWFNEIEDRWEACDKDAVGKWGDEVFGDHVVLYGFLPRFSDAVHPERFSAKYGRNKPPLLSNWPNKEFSRSDLDDQ
jgi:hypothetical protein